MAQQTQDKSSQKELLKKSNTAPNKFPTGRFHQDDTSRFAVTIGKLPEEVFAFWRDFKNLPQFMKDLKSIKVTSNKKSTWTVELKSGLAATWDAEIVSERSNEMIAWKSIEGSEVETAGSVWFSPAPAGRGTIVTLDMEYKVPGGKLSEVILTMMDNNIDMLIVTNLRRLKALLETGEIPTTEGQSSGREDGHDAQPGHAETKH